MHKIKGMYEQSEPTFRLNKINLKSDTSKISTTGRVTSTTLERLEILVISIPIL